VTGSQRLEDLVDQVRRAGLPAGPRSDPNAPARPPMPRRMHLAAAPATATGDVIVRRVLQLSGYSHLEVAAG
jgi:hypothetical protein